MIVICMFHQTYFLVSQLKIAQRSISEKSSTVEQQEKQIRELTTKLKEMSENEQKMAENARQ